jgi:hypothetical protein
VNIFPGWLAVRPRRTLVVHVPEISLISKQQTALYKKTTNNTSGDFHRNNPFLKL